MFANALYDNRSARIADTETLAGNPVDECLTAGCAKQCDVSDNDVFVLLELRTLRRIYCQLTAGQSLSEVVVAVALQFQCQTLWNECAEALTAGAVTLDNECVVLQIIVILSGDFILVFMWSIKSYS